MADENTLNEEELETQNEEAPIKYFSQNNIQYLLTELTKRLEKAHIEE